MKKRGQLVLLTLIILVIASILVVFLPKEAKAILRGEDSQKLAASRDIALILNSICSYPYDFEIEYDIDLTNFVVEISEYDVKVHSLLFIRLDPSNNIHGKDPRPRQYSFVCKQDLKFVLDSPKKIIFTKKDGNIDIKT